MYEFSDKPKDKQPVPTKPNLAVQQRPRQSGDRVKLSAFGDRHASQNLMGVDRVMPEKMRLKEQRTEEHMKSVKPGVYSGAEKSPDKLMELETDTGKAEIGYDRDKMNTVVSFTQDEQTGKGRQVVENKSLVKRAMGGSKFRSNDRSFENGAMSLRVDGDTSPRLLRRQLHKGSDKEDPTTLDRVIPFHSRKKTEKHQRWKLLQMQHQQRADRAGPTPQQRQGLSKAVTALSTMESQKSRMEMEFRQKFDKAVNKSRGLHRENDMYVILRRKKRLLYEATMLGGLLELSELADDSVIPGFGDADLEKTDLTESDLTETADKADKAAENIESEVRAGSEENGAT